ncbi:hypothetical protein B296_00002788 [Ensete ventricosum]|uniref:Uncharacterized protein n=1 Tax=Ensete ventricosum TaxID=4639 RepID=A0A427B1Q4_ENSVE|nr:hypothetical protein B296_00002788 [Ensete ventricosum]
MKWREVRVCVLKINSGEEVALDLVGYRDRARRRKSTTVGLAGKEEAIICCRWGRKVALGRRDSHPSDYPTTPTCLRRLPAHRTRHAPRMSLPPSDQAMRMMNGRILSPYVAAQAGIRVASSFSGARHYASEDLQPKDEDFAVVR